VGIGVSNADRRLKFRQQNYIPHLSPLNEVWKGFEKTAAFPGAGTRQTIFLNVRADVSAPLLTLEEALLFQYPKLTRRVFFIFNNLF